MAGNDKFPWLTQNGLNMKPVEVETSLAKTVWEPMKSREWRAVMARINPDRTFLNGRK